MKKKSRFGSIVLSCLCVTALSPCLSAAEDGIPAEIPTMVKFSNNSINRIHCGGIFKDLIVPEDKGVQGKFAGDSAYITFLGEVHGNKTVYPTEPAEIYAVCNGATYTIIAAPTPGINAVTVRLAKPKSDEVKQNIEHYLDMPLEKQVLQVIREAYNGDYPSSYRISSQSEELNISKDFDVNLKNTVEIDGVGIKLKEYSVHAKNTVDIDEKSFLNTFVSPSILAIALDKHQLKSGENSRLFVVEKKSGTANTNSDFGSMPVNFRMDLK
ncbi:MAG: type-F conjugative transfer system secretin TraK [Desulfobulbus sp.]|jgi:conjugal transfer pilus assembly protein TraK|nr:type-F conjugative transfer system secretin TraK [Desulfobulbus sp.]